MRTFLTLSIILIPGKNMITLFTVLILACFIVALGLFIFMMRFAVKTEVVVTTAMLTLLSAAGLFSWAILSAAETEVPQWSSIAYLSAILMFPILIILFIQRSTAESVLITGFRGRIMVFGPLLGQLLTHFLLPVDASRFTDFIFFMVWLLLSFMVWNRLFERMQATASDIRKNQLEFMLASFFVVVLYNIPIIFNLFLSDLGEFSIFFSMGIIVSLLVTVRGLVRYQMVIGTELLVRNSLIILLTSIFCVTGFIIAQIAVLSSAGTFDSSTQILISTVMLIVIVLSINLIGNFSTNLVERISPQLKWQESRVQEIFVLHSNGLVIAHAGSHEDSGIDRDLVGGMLTAIQNFVQEAFHTSEMDSLKSLSMGHLRVLIEAKGGIVVAVLFTGHEARELRKGVIWLMSEIDLKFGNVLHDWRGDKRSVMGVQEWLEGVLEKMAS